VREARRVIVYSEATRRDVQDEFRLPDEKLIVIPLAARRSFHPPTPAEVEQVRVKYRLPEGYVLYLGSNRPHKNLPCLVDAWGRMDGKAAIGARLVIAGYWDERYPKARRLAARMKLESSISFLGAIPENDLRGLYGGASLFVFPSLLEGFGLPVLEAMACGTPVACAQVSSLPEVAGEAAVYFTPTDPEHIAAVLQTTLTDPDLLQSLRLRGLERAGQFSWQSTARQIIQVYRALDLEN
jgi:alpha-1,3-rhamnosyl/mannosyltransferase